MTNKQKNYIDFICKILEIEFNGTTKYEAWKFINDNKDEAHNVYNSIKENYYDETDYMLFPDEGFYC